MTEQLRDIAARMRGDPSHFMHTDSVAVARQIDSAAEALECQAKQIEDLSQYATKCGEVHAAAIDQMDTLSKQLAEADALLSAVDIGWWDAQEDRDAFERSSERNASRAGQKRKA